MRLCLLQRRMTIRIYKKHVPTQAGAIACPAIAGFSLASADSLLAASKHQKHTCCPTMIFP
jgi:hypothetical protein